MPGRKVPLITDGIYHICNRGIDRRTTFLSRKEYQRAMNLLEFYQFHSPPIRYSKFLLLSVERREKLLEEMERSNQKLVTIYAFCLMPNHVHFLLKQNVDNGISHFMSQFQNSYTRYFNTVHERIGPLFLDQFKAVRIETDEQFVHVSRYIHLNPYTGFVVKDFEGLFAYPWSSLPEYFAKHTSGVCDTKEILSFFKNQADYKKFIVDQARYQRELHEIKHLSLDE